MKKNYEIKVYTKSEELPQLLEGVLNLKWKSILR
jgi:hypothetical protein